MLVVVKFGVLWVIFNVWMDVYLEFLDVVL